MIDFSSDACAFGHVRPILDLEMKSEKCDLNIVVMPESPRFQAYTGHPNRSIISIRISSRSSCHQPKSSAYSKFRRLI